MLIASNHASFADPPLIAAAFSYPVQFMARDTLFKNPFFAKVIRALNAMPVKRGTYDGQAFKSVLRCLKAGQAVLIFPEGTRTPDGQLQEAKPGLGLLALKANVPVLPVYIKGSFEAFPRKRIWPRFAPLSVHIGPLLNPPKPANKSEIGSLSRAFVLDVMNSIEKLS